MSSGICRTLKPPTVGEVRPIAIPRFANSSRSGLEPPGTNTITACGRACAGAAATRTASAHMSAPAARIRIANTLRAMPERTFVKYTFIKVDPEWRRRESSDRAQDKREFAAACNDFAEDHYLRTYSLVGTRGDCDLLVRSATPNLDAIHELHVVLN